MSISATYSSSMFSADDDIFETVSIDLKDANKTTYHQILITRRVEDVCFQYGENGNHMLDASEWEWLDTEGFIRKSRGGITRTINEKTAYLVNEFNVSDVSRYEPKILQAKIAHSVPFGDDEKFENLLDEKQLQDFQQLLLRSFGKQHAERVVGELTKIFRLLNTKVKETPMQVEIQTYTEWALWS